MTAALVIVVSNGVSHNYKPVIDTTVQEYSSFSEEIGSPESNNNEMFAENGSTSSSSTTTTTSTIQDNEAAEEEVMILTTTSNAAFDPNSSTTSSSPAGQSTSSYNPYGTTTAATHVYDTPNNGSEIPLSGTYTLRLKVIDFTENKTVKNLDCELFVYQTGKVVATWNTSETEELFITDLHYSFDSRDSYSGNIIYAIRILNLPEKYVFYYGKDKGPYAVSGMGIGEFADGTDLFNTVYLYDTSGQYTYATTRR